MQNWQMRLHKLKRDELFSYANLRQEKSGLPMVVWVPDPTARSTFLRVQVGHERESRPNDVVEVSISESPEIVSGRGLRQEELDLVCTFIRANLELLSAHASGKIDSAGLSRINRVDKRP